jgi:hypothetical protein
MDYLTLWILSRRSGSSHLRLNGLCLDPKALSPLIPEWLENSRFASALLLGCSGGLHHLIVLRAGHAFFDEPFIIAPPLVILVVAGRHRRFMST